MRGVSKSLVESVVVKPRLRVLFDFSCPSRSPSSEIIDWQPENSGFFQNFQTCNDCEVIFIVLLQGLRGNKNARLLLAFAYSSLRNFDRTVNNMQ
eukprot:IDg6691t1